MNELTPTLRIRAVAASHMTLVLTCGYMAFGGLTMLVFTAGFAGGFLLWLWFPRTPRWDRLRLPFWLALVLFLVHRVEEKAWGFFDMLSRVTGTPTPDILSLPLVVLLVLSVGGWVSVPTLLRRAHPFGAYLAWSFFASMGITELAHWLVFPFLQGEGWQTVPGMWSVLALAPVAWWGLWRLRGARTPRVPQAPAPAWRTKRIS